jgi:hypothetical protein
LFFHFIIDLLNWAVTINIEEQVVLFELVEDLKCVILVDLDSLFETFLVIIASITVSFDDSAPKNWFSASDMQTGHDFDIIGFVLLCPARVVFHIPGKAVNDECAMV